MRTSLSQKEQNSNTPDVVLSAANANSVNAGADASLTDYSVSLIYPRARSAGHDVNLRKQYWPDGRTESASNVRVVNNVSRFFKNLEGLHALFVQQQQTGTAMLMGEVIRSEEYKHKSGEVPRQMAGDSYGAGKDRTAGFKDVGRKYIVMDIDGVKTPDGHDWVADPEAAIEEIIYKSLPPNFHDVSFVWLWSGGPGIGKSCYDTTSRS